MKCRWQEGNRITLLENGDQYYPALFAAIGRASRRVILESFIWFEDEVGWRLHAVLLKAARRGIQVEVLLDGYGSPDLSDEVVGELTAAGVIVHIPAGIGVLEAVFIAMLSGEEISKGAIIAALLAWRALYYFLPLLLATVAYLLLESRAKKLRQKNERKLARE